MKFYLASFGTHNPYINLKLPEHAIYPISNSTGNTIDLDYTSLLLGEKYVIDKNVYEYVVESNKAYLKAMAHSLRFLMTEGYLEIIDVGFIVREKQLQLKQKVDVLTSNHSLWLEIIQSQWKNVKNEFQIFHNKFGSPEMEYINTNHYPILNYLETIGESDNYRKRDELIQLINSTKKFVNAKQRDELIEVFKPLVGQILINDMVRSELNIPVLDWLDNEPYYSNLDNFRWINESKNEIYLQKNNKVLFDFVIPELKPQSIEQVVKFIESDLAVSTLRNELWNYIKSNPSASIDMKWHNEFLKRVLNKEMTVKKKSKYYRWIGAIAGLIIPGSSVLTEIAIEVGQNFTEDIIEDKSLASHNWYYTLQKQYDKNLKQI